MFNKNFYQDFISLTTENITLIKEAEIYARKIMSNDDLHGIGHIERVIINSKKIALIEGGNPFIIFFSAWLHDIGRIKKLKLDKNHGEISAELVQNFIVDKNLNISPYEQEKIIGCIESHSFSSGKKQEFLEAKILSDADKLDALGGIGIYRASSYQNINGTGIKGLIKHFNVKLLKLSEKMQTQTGKKLALNRQDFMYTFIQRLNSEIK
ncbi:MAG: HD domain-containing protein [archaeon]|nr:HD domain-containing protein [archaeon]